MHVSLTAYYLHVDGKVPKLIVYSCLNGRYMFSLNVFTHCHINVGPLRSTLVDHWRMIWQEHPHTIVMVTNIKEGKKIKCQRYWPEGVFEDFGPFRITLGDQQMFANFTIRLFQVEVSII